MGDRANVVVEQYPLGKKDGRVYLYTHWGGDALPCTLQAALTRGKSRWNDASYLTRIIFDEMLNGDRDLTGFGISNHLTDNEHPLLVVDCEKQTVTLETESGKALAHWDFPVYIALTKPTLSQAYSA